jgi:hypothetical protein
VVGVARVRVYRLSGCMEYRAYLLSLCRVSFGMCLSHSLVNLRLRLHSCDVFILYRTPMEVLKSKLMINSPSPTTQPKQTPNKLWNFTNNRTLHLAKSILEREGWRGFMKGYWISLGVFAPYSFVYDSTPSLYFLLQCMLMGCIVWIV